MSAEKVDMAGETEAGSDDRALPFQVDALDVRGRVVTLGPALDNILRRHEFPDPVRRLVGEATVLASLLATSLKDTGRFILQAQTEGAVSMVVVDIRTPGQIRATATFDAEAVARLEAGGEFVEFRVARGNTGDVAVRLVQYVYAIHGIRQNLLERPETGTAACATFGNFED